MKKTCYFCDICEAIKSYEEIYEINVKSGSFINYANYDAWFPDVKKIHICKECVDNFKEYINEKNELR